jgi:hypothetical protein
MANFVKIGQLVQKLKQGDTQETAWRSYKPTCVPEERKTEIKN